MAFHDALWVAAPPPPSPCLAVIYWTVGWGMAPANLHSVEAGFRYPNFCAPGPPPQKKVESDVNMNDRPPLFCKRVRHTGALDCIGTEQLHSENAGALVPSRSDVATLWPQQQSPHSAKGRLAATNTGFWGARP